MLMKAMKARGGRHPARSGPVAGRGRVGAFFGRWAYTMTLPARLARQFDAIVLFVYGERLPKVAATASTSGGSRSRSPEILPGCRTDEPRPGVARSASVPRSTSGATTATRSRPVPRRLRRNGRQNAWGANLGVFLINLTRNWSQSARTRLAHALSDMFWWLARPRRRVTMTNLRACFPEMPEAERERIGRADFRSLVRAALDHSVLWKCRPGNDRELHQGRGRGACARSRQSPADSACAALRGPGCRRRKDQYDRARSFDLLEAEKSGVGCVAAQGPAALQRSRCCWRGRASTCAASCARSGTACRSITCRTWTSAR